MRSGGLGFASPCLGIAPIPACRRRGTVLIVTVALILVLASLALVLGRSMRVETLASANHLAALQAAGVERGAEQYLLALIEQDKDAVLTEAEETFAQVQVGDGYFWVIRPDYGDDSSGYGVVDEAAKINLNTASRDTLLALPNMSEELADAIIDWRDPDENTSPTGAESDYYLSLPEPYQCKNGPLESVEELLLVKGFTTDVLYGPITTGLAGTAETTFPAPAALADLMTICSAEDSRSATGQSRVNLNDGNRQPLSDLLNQQLGAARAGQVLARARPTPPFRDVFDFYFRAGLTPEEFAKVIDRLGTSTQATVRGLVNVNTASRDVLLCLPGLDENDVANLIAQRSATGADHSNLAWLVNVLGPKAVGLGNLLTAHASQYSAEIVAASGNGRAFVRYRVVIDARTTPARIVYRRDLSQWGWPLDQQVLSGLRQGNGAMGSGFMTGRTF